MNNSSKSYIIPTGLAIFAMLFGAGNLIYPLKAGLEAGDKTFVGMLGFLLTAVCIPVAGLVGVILFDGDYTKFFNRLGRTTGKIFIFLCMIILGPGLVIPRIVTLSHVMTAPFFPLPFLQEITLASSFIFALIFLGVSFLLTYRENKIMDVIGKFISPALLISLTIIIVKGIFSAKTATATGLATVDVLKTNIVRGYETLDLLGTIFFGSIILHILKETLSKDIAENKNRLALISLQAGFIGTMLLGVVYLGMSFLGAYHGHELGGDTIFREIAFRVLGTGGAAVIAVAVLMACFSTSIALGAVIGEYLQFTIFNNKVRFVSSLALGLIACVPLSTFGLKTVLTLTAGPITYIGYPVLIVLTFCNIGYKLFGFKPVKLPVALTFVAALVSYIW